jgi:NAD+ diphosphatase
MCNMDHYKRPSLNHFTTRGVDRVTGKRGDDEWLAGRLQVATTRFIPIWRSKNLFAAGQITEPVFLRPHQVPDLVGTAGSTAVLLGVDGNGAYFAIDVSSEGDAPPAALVALGQFRDLRRVAALLDEKHCALLAYAKGIIHWHHRHRFCGDCGSPTTSVEGGYLRVCTSEACGRQHFPRVDPAIIVLVASGNRCLLGRKPEWPAGRYSTIAGFVEPGESLEAAVIREVQEETGIEVDEVRYFASQPWPFPSSLMLGFTARGVSEEIHIGEDELEDARWFTREQLRDSLRQGTVELPFRLAISFHLIENWFDAGDLGSLGYISGG